MIGIKYIRYIVDFVQIYKNYNILFSDKVTTNHKF